MSGQLGRSEAGGRAAPAHDDEQQRGKDDREDHPSRAAETVREDDEHLSVAAIPVARLRLRRRLPRTIPVEGAAHVVGFLEPSLRVTPPVEFVGAGVDRSRFAPFFAIDTRRRLEGAVECPCHWPTRVFPDCLGESVGRYWLPEQVPQLARFEFPHVGAGDDPTGGLCVSRFARSSRAAPMRRTPDRAGSESQAPYGCAASRRRRAENSFNSFPRPLSVSAPRSATCANTEPSARRAL